MTSTEFRRMLKALNKNGWFVIHNPDGSRTELRRSETRYGHEIALYNVSKPNHGVCERNCVLVSENVDSIKDILIG